MAILYACKSYITTTLPPCVHISFIWRHIGCKEKRIRERERVKRRKKVKPFFFFVTTSSSEVIWTMKKRANLIFYSWQFKRFLLAKYLHKREKMEKRIFFGKPIKTMLCTHTTHSFSTRRLQRAPLSHPYTPCWDLSNKVTFLHLLSLAPWHTRRGSS